ncbi:hypothetical protein D9M68_687640 [compost metagenome]
MKRTTQPGDGLLVFQIVHFEGLNQSMDKRRVITVLNINCSDFLCREQVKQEGQVRRMQIRILTEFLDRTNGQSQLGVQMTVGRRRKGVCLLGAGSRIWRQEFQQRFPGRRCCRVKHEEPDVVTQIGEIRMSLECHQHLGHCACAPRVEGVDRQRLHIRVLDQITLHARGKISTIDGCTTDGWLWQAQGSTNLPNQATRVLLIGRCVQGPERVDVVHSQRCPPQLLTERNDRRKCRWRQLLDHRVTCRNHKLLVARPALLHPGLSEMAPRDMPVGTQRMRWPQQNSISSPALVVFQHEGH